jgi:hypothetical protein
MITEANISETLKLKFCYSYTEQYVKDNISIKSM